MLSSYRLADQSFNTAWCGRITWRGCLMSANFSARPWVVWGRCCHPTSRFRFWFASRGPPTLPSCIWKTRRLRGVICSTFLLQRLWSSASKCSSRGCHLGSSWGGVEVWLDHQKSIVLQSSVSSIPYCVNDGKVELSFSEVLGETFVASIFVELQVGVIVSYLNK